MTGYTTTDRDPADRGIHRAPARPRPGPGRRTPVELTEGRLTPPDAGRTVLLYGTDGRPVGDEPRAAARSVTEAATGASSYAVRVSTWGPDAGLLLDPRGASFGPGDLGVVDPRTGLPRYQLRTVAEAVFGDYLTYLTHRTASALGRAQRALLHG